MTKLGWPRDRLRCRDDASGMGTCGKHIAMCTWCMYACLDARGSDVKTQDEMNARLKVRPQHTTQRLNGPCRSMSDARTDTSQKCQKHASSCPPLRLWARKKLDPRACAVDLKAKGVDAVDADSSQLTAHATIIKTRSMAAAI